VKVKLVDGKRVRDKKNIDFALAGHNLRYSFIPKKEVWMEKTIKPKERKFIKIHELYENGLMKRNVSYGKAHNMANVAETYARKNPRYANMMIKNLQRVV
jgi:hypothetical protein